MQEMASAGEEKARWDKGLAGGEGTLVQAGLCMGMQAAWELVHAEEKGHSGVAGRMKKNGPSRLVGAEI